MSSAFPLTPWSSILRGEELDDDARRQLLRRLLARYWRPLYGCVRFGWELPEEEATRRLEEFFWNLLNTDLLRGLDPEKGRFREFLKARLSEFMAATADQPPGDAPRETGIADLASAGGEALEPRPAGEPEEVFDACWVELLIERALERYAEEAAGEPQDGPWAVFSRVDLRPDGESGASRARLAAEIGVAETELAERLHEARKHFRRLLAQEVHDYALDDADAREELRWTIG